MRRFAIATLIAASALSACYAPDPKDGLVRCAPAGKACPDGYHCFGGTCWRHAPGVMRGADMARSGPPASAPDGSANASACSDPSECPAPGNACVTAACVAGSCTTKPAPAGTMLPTSAQTQDCARLVCDGNGMPTAQPDPAHVPDDHNDCTIDSCNGLTAVHMAKAAGSACGSGGFCNASGTCGVCAPGAKDCAANNVPRSCGDDGAWHDGAACPYVCAGGACTGVCVPGNKQCKGAVPETCDATGKWQDGSACPNVCTNGMCSGSCSPGSTQCAAGNVLLTCGSDGKWPTTGTACQYVCLGGPPAKCGGVCSPGQKQCSGNTPQTCDATGQWQSGSTCQYVCSGGGCTGVCTPGSVQCSGSTVQTCDGGGNWTNTTTCSGAQVVCSNGKCVCVPQTCGNACNLTAGDGCGGNITCGDCPGGQVCLHYQCCQPNCNGKACGDDGCGGSCGTCPGNATQCQSGQCVCNLDCTPCFQIGAGCDTSPAVCNCT